MNPTDDTAVPTKEELFEDLAEAANDLQQSRDLIAMYEETLSETMSNLNHERAELHGYEKAFDAALAAWLRQRGAAGVQI